jgi:hypothetical protein
MGYGSKVDFTSSKELNQIPGAKYDNHEINSIDYLSKKKNPNTQYGFFNNFDKYEPICYKG